MNRLLYNVMPISLLVLPYVFYPAFDGAGFYFDKESGAVENITAVLLAIAIFFVARTFWKVRATSSVAFRFSTFAWLVIFGLGCVYFLGEEISWGQHLFGWATPESWMAVNDQGETNLHNMSGWLDQIPRTVLTIGIIAGGLVSPLIRKWRNGARWGHKGETFLIHFMPGWNCVTGAACVTGIILLGVLYALTGFEWLGISVGEVKESLISMFLLVYIVDFGQRLMQSKASIEAENNSTSISNTIPFPVAHEPSPKQTSKQTSARKKKRA